MSGNVNWCLERCFAHTFCLTEEIHVCNSPPSKVYKKSSLRKYAKLVLFAKTSPKEIGRQINFASMRAFNVHMNTTPLLCIA